MVAWSRGSSRLRPVWQTPRTALRDLRNCYSIAHTEGDPSIRPVASLNRTDYGSVGSTRFRDLAFTPEKPLLMRAGPMFVQSGMAMPAIKKWFDFASTDKSEHKRTSEKIMSAYLKSFSSTAILPFELAYPQVHRLHGEAVHRFIDSLRQEGGFEPLRESAQASSKHDNSASLAAPIGLANLLEAQLPTSSGTEYDEHLLGHPTSRPIQRVLHFMAPLALLDAADNFNLERPGTGLRKLYVAQAPLENLPKELRDDLPVPNIVKHAGRGDIYNSSIWLGLEPTYTPLHRDPNPNLFIQLCSNKVVRLLPPTSGDQLFRDVQLRLGNSSRVNSRLRGPEMMDGPERYLMHKAVWFKHGLREMQAPEGFVLADEGVSRSKMEEARLLPGDALFIPKGWWHSVTSENDAGRLNASVNWWFR